MNTILKEFRAWQVPTLLAVGGFVLIFLSFFKVEDIFRAAFSVHSNLLIGPMISGCSLVLLATGLHIIGRKHNGHVDPNKPTSNSTLVDSILELIPDRTTLSTSYARILRAQHSLLSEGIRQLAARGDWARLIKVRARIREYYEWSGQYEEGIEQGQIFLDALRAVDAPEEELYWARVKDVGWLQILAGHLETGREQMAAVLSGITLADTKPEVARLAFYCHRYMGVSYQRQEPADLDRAAASFRDAEDTIPRIHGDTRDLAGRIARNIGNVALDLGQTDGVDTGQIHKARTKFEESLRVFLELQDEEHQAITRIQLGQALIATAGCLEEGHAEFLTARRLATRIGWQEGVARSSFFLGKVHEQRASHTEDLVVRRMELKSARDEYEDCDRICSQIDDFLWKGRAKESLMRVSHALSTIP